MFLKYEAPEMNIVYFDAEDVIATSVPDEDELPILP